MISLGLTSTGRLLSSVSLVSHYTGNMLVNPVFKAQGCPANVLFTTTALKAIDHITARCGWQGILLGTWEGRSRIKDGSDLYGGIGVVNDLGHLSAKLGGNITYPRQSKVDGTAGDSADRRLIQSFQCSLNLLVNNLSRVTIHTENLAQVVKFLLQVLL